MVVEQVDFSHNFRILIYGCPQIARHNLGSLQRCPAHGERSMNKIGFSSKIPAKMEAGELAPWVAAFATELGSLRHTALTVIGYTDCARHFAAWLAFNKIGLDEVGDRMLGQFAKHRCRCGGYRRAMRFSDQLSEPHSSLHRVSRHARRDRAAGNEAANPFDPLVVDYQEWLERPSWRLRADNRAPRQDGHAPASSIGLRSTNIRCSDDQEGDPVGGTTLFACLHQDDDDRAARIFTFSRRGRSLSSWT